MTRKQDRSRYPLPPARTTVDGASRRIGVEIELIGPGVPEVARVVSEHTGGEAQSVSRYEYEVGGDEAGTWRVEIDQELLKKMGRERESRDEPLPLLDEAAEELLRFGSELLVPVEIVSPPLPMERLPEFDRLTGALREAGAKGTGANPAYAFGLQFNPELPALDADTVTRYLKAFLCLYDWLKSRSQVDATRKLTGFAKPFPADYVRRVVNPGYRPDLAALMDDYLRDNPTRNRALDMLPLFAHLDEDRVRAAVEDSRIKARPTLHYRLPNSELGRADWGVFVAWGDWLEVERLACDRKRLDDICGAYHELLKQPLGGMLADWAGECEQWLKNSAGQ
ncbi:amidoligase family protein [Elongatibacter sediminis]|uniref:Amidoligase family protein n=1 Tax=Elongatibacter sediminis TaxID=3119006 RepID=A0AAW9R5X4_9GAMM